MSERTAALIIILGSFASYYPLLSYGSKSLGYPTIRRYLKSPAVRQADRFMRILALAGLLATSLILFALGHFKEAGNFLLALSVLRLVSLQTYYQYWCVCDLRQHIRLESVHHSVTLTVFTVGLNVSLLTRLQSLGDAPRVTISLTLTVAALVAFNKSMTRTRKLCTELCQQISSVRHSFAKMYAAIAKGESSPSLKAAQIDCIKEIDTLSRLLDTRLNTGYRVIGAQILPSSVSRRLIAALRVSVRGADPSARVWLSSERDLRLIHGACARWMDSVA
ncbi:hypothetical protein [Streptomyces sp. MJM1172]|uniref:hypothetical protein n=1 Tax=Streptomyces sp. MJM1172 TaxID=1703926 RepID=UPI000A790DD3|nr:hypothetical protein [Streptomyces sp. MJM1172]